jgi:IMP dehydrogenase
MNKSILEKTINLKETITFDDVLLMPAYSEVLPKDAEVKTKITKDIELNIPLISSAMDTVTEEKMAIAMAQAGGIGCIHKNLSIKEQALSVKKVKKFEAGIVADPVTINHDETLDKALGLMEKNGISAMPVLAEGGKLVGVLSNRDVRFATNKKHLVSELMTKDNLITVQKNISNTDVKKLLHKHKIERLIVVDENYRCRGLITGKDILKSKQFPMACKDKNGRLRVAAAIGVGRDAIKRAEALIEEGVDLLIIDTAHGHSRMVGETLLQLKKQYPQQQIIAGNIATAEAAKYLIDHGADAVKVGIGPGSICTTRIISGVGFPQFSASLEVRKACEKNSIPFISDGGIKFSGDIAKAIAGGADCVMIGSLFAGTEESPGDIVLYKGRSYKSYRGMGSLGAMSRGSADRYFQEDIENAKMVPEGVEGRVPYKGSVFDVLHQIVGGLKSSMGYTGNKNIFEMKNNCAFSKITNSGLSESHSHGVSITNESPNYSI